MEGITDCHTMCYILYPTIKLPKTGIASTKVSVLVAPNVSIVANTTTDRFIGDAAATWKKTHAKLPASKCVCSPDEGCGEDCLNRTMQYECNDSNCNVGERYCKNRAFAELKWRSKGKCFSRKPEKPEHMSDQDYEALRKEMGFGAEPNLWGEGVEVVKTKDRGYGVRSMRTFTPGQIIVEYCGEIITPEEADRRMNEEYKDKNVSIETVCTFGNIGS